MPTRTVRTSKSPAQVRVWLEREVANRNSRMWKIITSRVIHSLLTDIHKAYMEKSAGGTDELGNKWEDIKPETKAYSRGSEGLGRSRRSRTGRGILTAAQDKMWRMIYSSMLRNLSRVMDEGEAKKIAAGHAWERVKAAGGETKIGLLGGRKVPIMVSSHRLERSLRPGRLTKYSYTPYNKDQKVIVSLNSVTVRSAVPYAKEHKKRPPIPDDLGEWRERAVEKGQQAVFDYLTTEL